MSNYQLFFFKLTIATCVTFQKRSGKIKRELSVLMFKSPFTRQKNGVRTRGKRGTDRIILAVYKDNNLPWVGQNLG